MDSVIAPTSTPDLPDRVAAWIRAEGGSNAILLVSVDGLARPHMMMLARDEIHVISATQLRVAVGAKSQTAENLRLRTSATLGIYDADLACMVKTHAMAGAREILDGVMAFYLTVEDVRLDRPAAAEAHARLVTGLRFEGRAERADIRQRLEELEPR